jgi:hypothetical protein
LKVFAQTVKHFFHLKVKSIVKSIGLRLKILNLKNSVHRIKLYLFHKNPFAGIRSRRTIWSDFSVAAAGRKRRDEADKLSGGDIKVRLANRDFEKVASADLFAIFVAILALYLDTIERCFCSVRVEVNAFTLPVGSAHLNRHFVCHFLPLLSGISGSLSSFSISYVVKYVKG